MWELPIRAGDAVAQLQRSWLYADIYRQGWMNKLPTAWHMGCTGQYIPKGSRVRGGYMRPKLGNKHSDLGIHPYRFSNDG